MGSMAKKLQANEDKEVLFRMMGKRPKHRCPVCHRFTLWRVSKNGKTKECHWCVQKIRDEAIAKAEAISKSVRKEGGN